jgi:hypothetical protein
LRVIDLLVFYYLRIFDLIREEASLEGDSFTSILLSQDIWPDKRSGLWRKGLLYIHKLMWIQDHQKQYCEINDCHHLSNKSKVTVLFHISLLRNLIYEWGLVWFRIMVFNTTFNNISVISWQSVLLMKETRVPGEN